ncbi:hypothetical protein ACFPRL_05225 [Pseudoclavibacter helvolus]
MRDLGPFPDARSSASLNPEMSSPDASQGTSTNEESCRPNMCPDEPPDFSAWQPWLLLLACWRADAQTRAATRLAVPRIPRRLR